MASKKNIVDPSVLKVKRSKTGLGLYTLADISKDSFIIEYKGEVLTRDEADKRAGKYLFEVSKNKFVDGTSRENTARYLNHSHRPNCEVVIEKGHINIYAKKKIKAEEELVYDYGKEYVTAHCTPCLCPKCEGKNHEV